MKNKTDPTQTKTKYETQVTVLDPTANNKAVTLRMMDDEPPKLATFSLMQPVWLVLKVVRGDWDDSLGLSGIIPQEAPKTSKP